MFFENESSFSLSTVKSINILKLGMLWSLICFNDFIIIVELVNPSLYTLKELAKTFD
jgi:hypothetical protein